MRANRADLERGIRHLEYTTVDTVLTSDHSPVRALLLLRVPLPPLDPASMPGFGDKEGSRRTAVLPSPLHLLPAAGGQWGGGGGVPAAMFASAAGPTRAVASSSRWGWLPSPLSSTLDALGLRQVEEQRRLRRGCGGLRAQGKPLPGRAPL